MKLSNFTPLCTIGSTPLDLEYFATVTATTGALFWKRSVRRTIHRKYAESWHFVDTGEFTPGYQAEELERACKSMALLEKQVIRSFSDAKVKA